MHQKLVRLFRQGVPNTAMEPLKHEAPAFDATSFFFLLSTIVMIIFCFIRKVICKENDYSIFGLA